MEAVKRDGKPREVHIPQVKVQTEDLTGQGFSLGKVKLEAKGVLRKGLTGRPVFVGILQEGKNMEVFTFPKGNRSFWKELPSTIGRYVPFTMFRTVITGQRTIRVEF